MPSRLETEVKAVTSGKDHPVERLVPDRPIRPSWALEALGLVGPAGLLVLIGLGGWSKIASAATFTGPPGLVGVFWLFLGTAIGFAAYSILLGLYQTVSRVGVADIGLVVVRRFGTTQIPWDQLRREASQSLGPAVSIYYLSSNGPIPTLRSFQVTAALAARLLSDPRFPRATLS